MSEIILYTADDGRTRLDLRVEGQTVWLTQLEIAELFQTTKQNVSLHARNISALSADKANKKQVVSHTKPRRSRSF